VLRARSFGYGGQSGARWGGVVRGRLLEDRRVDEGEHVRERAEPGRLDERLHPGARGDGACGCMVVGAVEVGAGEREAGVALVEPGPVPGAQPYRSRLYALTAPPFHWI